MNKLVTKEWHCFDASEFKKGKKELSAKPTFLEFGSHLEESEEGGEKEIGKEG